MLNVLKMDLYRLSRTKSAWLMILLGVVFTIFSTFMIKEDIKNMQSDRQYMETVQAGQESYENSGKPTINIGYNCNTKYQWAEKNHRISVWDLFNVNMASRTYLLFIGIATAIFVYAEHKNGFIKAIAGILPSRSGFALSKFISTGIYTIVYFVIIFIFQAISSAVVFGYVNFGFSVEFMKFTLVILLMHLSFTAIITSLGIVTQSSGLPVFIAKSSVCHDQLVEESPSFITNFVRNFKANTNIKNLKTQKNLKILLTT